MFRFYLAALVVVVAVLATQSVAKEDGLEGLIKKVIAKLEKKDQAAEKQAFEKALERFTHLEAAIVRDLAGLGCNDTEYAVVTYTKMKKEINDKLKTHKADIVNKVQNLKRGGADADGSVKRSLLNPSFQIESLFAELTEAVKDLLDALGKITDLQTAYQANQDATAKTRELDILIWKYIKKDECKTGKIKFLVNNA